MLRPFVLLASMSNASRTQIACLLGWPMIEADYFGDAQEEAYEILFRVPEGLIARLQQTQGMWEKMFQAITDWYQLVYQVTRSVFGELENFRVASSKTSMTACQTFNNAWVEDIETKFWQKLASKLKEKMGSKAENLERLEESKILVQAAKRISDALTSGQARKEAVDGCKTGLIKFAFVVCFMACAKRDGSDFGLAPYVKASQLVEEMEGLFGGVVVGTPRLFDSKIDDPVEGDPGYSRVFECTEKSILESNMEPVWVTMQLLDIPETTGHGRILPIIMSLLLHKARLKIHNVLPDKQPVTKEGEAWQRG